MTSPVLVGAVSQLYQGDLDVGRVVLERLAEGSLGPAIVVEDLSYGAVAVSQRLAELAPAKLVLVGAADRGREPGTVERRAVSGLDVGPAEVQRSVADAVTGYVSIDLVLEVAHGFRALPVRTVVVEVQPGPTWPAERLSPAVEAAVPSAVELVLAELPPSPAGSSWARSS